MKIVMPCISIICATYNVHIILSSFLASIRGQTSKDFELVIIDGDSADGTKDIISINSDIIDKFVSEKDNGIYDAWNKGVELASCDWICFVGADDVLEPNFVEVYSEAIQDCRSRDADYISSRVNYLSENGSVFRILGEPWVWSKFRKRMTTAHVGSLHHKRLFYEVGGFDTSFKICGDYELLLRKGKQLKTVFIDEVLVNMASGGASLGFKAIVEKRKAQMKNRSVSAFLGFLILIFDFFALCVFKLKMWWKDVLFFQRKTF